MILELEAGENIRYGMLDSSLWHNKGDVGTKPSRANDCKRMPLEAIRPK